MFLSKIKLFLQTSFYILYPICLYYLFYQQQQRYYESIDSCVNFLNKLNTKSNVIVDKKIYYSLKDKSASYVLKKILSANVFVYKYQLKGNLLYVVLLPTQVKTKLIKKYYKEEENIVFSNSYNNLSKENRNKESI